MKNQIKELRVMIDGVAQLTKKLKPFQSNKNPGVLDQIWSSQKSKQIEKSTDNLYLAKAWLGMCLGELGNETPYKNDGKRKSVEDIESTADVSSGQGLFKDDFELLWWKEELNHIEKVDWIRGQIKLLTNKVKHLDAQTFSENERPSREFSIARTSAYNHLCEARFWLGFELERLKKQE